jgi:RNA polymerase sigma-70 factor, ECF subfamily
VRELDVHATSAPAESGGGRLALGDVYRAHARLVSRWIRLLDPAGDPEDLLHEVFLVVSRKLAGFRGDAALTTWLYGITLRVVGGERRKRRLRRLLFGRFGTELADERPAPPTPEESSGRARASVVLYSLLDELGERDRAMLIAFELEGLPGRELAGALGMSEQSLWTALHRARTRLRQAYVARFGDEEGRP